MYTAIGMDYEAVLQYANQGKRTSTFQPRSTSNGSSKFTELFFCSWPPQHSGGRDLYILSESISISNKMENVKKGNLMCHHYVECEKIFYTC